MTTRQRVHVAIVIGTIAFVLSLFLLTRRGLLAGDFTWLWGAGRDLLTGHNPYHNPQFALGNPYPFTNPLPYPLPAVLLTLPFAFLNPYFAGALFYGISSGILAYGVTKDGLWRLPLFLSVPFVVGAGVAQWSPLLMAAMFLPALPILAIKPNIALPLAAENRNLWGIGLAAGLCVVSLAILPTWPWDMLRNAAEHHHTIPLLVLPGPLVLLALIHWRHREARLLVLFAAIPQVIRWYDQLYLWLIPRTAWQSLALTAASWIGYVSWFVLHGGGMGQIAVFGPHDLDAWVICSTYLPALVLVLWQAHPISYRIKSSLRPHRVPSPES